MNKFIIFVLLVMMITANGCTTYYSSSKYTVTKKTPVLREVGRGRIITRTLHTGSGVYPHVEDSGTIIYPYSVWAYDEPEANSK